MAQLYIQQRKNNLTYFTAPSFSETQVVSHAFTTRLGGVSAGKYDSLNLGLFTADKPDNILENRRRVCQTLNIGIENLVGGHQVHGDHVYCVTKADQGRGATGRRPVIPDTDALMTNEPGMALITFFADCAPVLFLDPVKKVIALAHAGWKGTVAKIAVKTVQAMGERYGAQPQRLLAVVGPSIGPCHYQIDRPVLEKVQEAFPGAWPRLLTGFTGEDHAYLNLWEANSLQLIEAGLVKDNITVMNLCTYCHQDLLFSHRAGMAGRQAAVLMLNQE